MSRLTKVMHCDDGNKLYDYSNEVVRECKDFSSRLELMFKKLAHYEDLEEQGLLLKLPCKVGDKLYQVTGDITEFKVDTFYIHEDRILVSMENEEIGLGFTVDVNRIGKRYFLTKEEAEAKLKELQNE